MNLRPLTLLLVSGLFLAPAHAQEPPRPAVVLAVSDVTRGPLVEALGVAIYGRLLEGGPYGKVSVVQGRDKATQRIAVAITELAKTHPQVDVVVSAHTVKRSAAELQRLLPPEARQRLRLVFSVACFGASEERAAWQSVGARTIVTYQGINNPLWSCPSFLSDWIRGAPVRPALDRATRETALAHRFVFSLPGTASIDRRIITGSVPVLTGDPNLTVASGWLPDRTVAQGLHRILLGMSVSPDLRYSRKTGSSLGLALRCLVGRLTVETKDVAPLLQQLQLSAPFTQVDPKAFRRAFVRTVDVPPPVPHYAPLIGPFAWLFPGPPTPTAELVLELESAQLVPLYKGLSLRFGTEVTLRAKELDPLERRIGIEVTGIDLVGYGLSYALDTLEVVPHPRGGYALRVGGKLLQILPLGGSYPIGGTTPAPLAERPPRATVGVGVGVGVEARLGLKGNLER